MPTRRSRSSTGTRSTTNDASIRRSSSIIFSQLNFVVAILRFVAGEDPLWAVRLRTLNSNFANAVDHHLDEDVWKRVVEQGLKPIRESPGIASFFDRLFSPSSNKCSTSFPDSRASSADDVTSAPSTAAMLAFLRRRGLCITPLSDAVMRAVCARHCDHSRTDAMYRVRDLLLPRVDNDVNTSTKSCGVPLHAAPLHVAVQFQDLEMFDLLCDAGFSVTERGRSLHDADQCRYSSCSSSRKNGHKVCPFTQHQLSALEIPGYFCREHEGDPVSMPLWARPEPDSESNDDDNPLSRAIVWLHTLLDRAPDQPIGSVTPWSWCNYERSQALLIACRCGDSVLVQRLVESGCFIDFVLISEDNTDDDVSLQSESTLQRQRQGVTALSVAICFGHLDVVKILLGELGCRLEFPAPPPQQLMDQRWYRSLSDFQYDNYQNHNHKLQPNRVALIEYNNDDGGNNDSASAAALHPMILIDQTLVLLTENEQRLLQMAWMMAKPEARSQIWSYLRAVILERHSKDA